MVRDMETFYPRKDEMGNGPIELVLGDVLDKVSEQYGTVPHPSIYRVEGVALCRCGSHERTRLSAHGLRG